MRNNNNVLLLLVILVFSGKVLWSQSVTVTYEIINKGKLLEDVQLVLTHQYDITAIHYGNEQATSFIDFGRQSIVRTLFTKKDTVKQSTLFSSLEQPVWENEPDTIAGYPCRKGAVNLFSNHIEFWVTDSLGNIGSPYTAVMPWQGMILKIVHNGSYIIEAVRVEKGDEIPMLSLENMEEVDKARFNALEIADRFVHLPIFRDQQINFGDSIVNPPLNLIDTTYRVSKGTVILKKVALPHRKATQIMASLSVRSLGDAYDRTGSVFALPNHDKGMLAALFDGLDRLPVFLSNDSVEYQGIIRQSGYEPPVELMRFFTSFGVGYFNDRVPIEGYSWADSTFYKADITSLMSSLGDTVWIGVFIGNYDRGGHEVSLSLDFYPDEDDQHTHWVCPLFNTVNIMEMSGQEYGTLFLNDTLEVMVDIPANVNNLQLIFTTTGHGGWGNGDEFVPKKNQVFMDGRLIFDHVPWRSDCGSYRLLNPSSGNFGNGMSSSDYSRSNWCPGTLTPPYFIPLNDVTPGIHTFSVVIPMGSREGGSFSSWNVSGTLTGWQSKSDQ